MATWHCGVCGCRVCKNLKADWSKQEPICKYSNEEFGEEIKLGKCANFNK